MLVDSLDDILVDSRDMHFPRSGPGLHFTFNTPRPTLTDDIYILLCTVYYPTRRNILVYSLLLTPIILETARVRMSEII